MRTAFTFLLLFFVWTGYAQKKKHETVKPQPIVPEQAPSKPDTVQKPEPQRQINPFISHFSRKRDLALRWNDTQAAKDALYDLITETGNDSLAYLLAVSYYENQQYASAVLISKDLLQGNPSNMNYLQLSALSFEGLGIGDKALGNYESMYLLSDNTAVLYKMASLQYDTKRYAECKANVDILLTKPDLDKLNVSVNMADNKPKDFPIKVAILNIKGMLAEHGGDKVGARKAYTDALAISPDFPLAKQNLAKLK